MYMQRSARCESSSSGYDDVTYVYDDVTYVYAAVGKMRKQLFGISYMDGSSGSAGGDRSQFQYKMYFKQEKFTLIGLIIIGMMIMFYFCLQLSVFKNENTFCKRDLDRALCLICHGLLLVFETLKVAYKLYFKH